MKYSENKGLSLFKESLSSIVVVSNSAGKSPSNGDESDGPTQYDAQGFHGWVVWAWSEIIKTL